MLMPARKFIYDSIRYWIREYRIDGIRFDAAKELNSFDALERFRHIQPRYVFDETVFYGRRIYSAVARSHRTARSGRKLLERFVYVCDGRISDGRSGQSRKDERRD